MPNDAQRSAPNVHPKATATGVLRRIGVPPETIEALERELPDPVDIDSESELLLRHGITRDRLINRMSGSP